MLVVSWPCRRWPGLSLRQFWLQETCLSCCLKNDGKMRAFGSQQSGPSSRDEPAEANTCLGLHMENVYGTWALGRLQ